MVACPPKIDALETPAGLGPVLVPLIVSAFRRADELAMAMESRCYHGGEGRTRMRELHFHARDLISTVLLVVFLVGIIVLEKLPL